MGTEDLEARLWEPLLTPDIVTGSMSGIVAFVEMENRVVLLRNYFGCHDPIVKRSTGVAPTDDHHELELYVFFSDG
jgi:hypothetical protein